MYLALRVATLFVPLYRPSVPVFDTDVADSHWHHATADAQLQVVARKNGGSAVPSSAPLLVAAG